ncbi:hypothetical protein JCM10207_008980 [Rhodosporidiobolus poonsookiae]
MKGTLTVISYNIRHSPRILETLLNTLTGPAALPVDLLLLQEPPRSLPSLPPGWSALLPPPLPLPRPDDEPTVPRSVTLVAPSLAGAVEQVVVASRDVVAADLRTEGGSVCVVGVYNPDARSPFANRSVESVLPPLLAASDPSRPLIVAGNFNLRHPSWDPELARETTDAKEEAKLTFDEAGLVLLRPPGAPTWCGGKNKSKRGTLDLALGNLQAEALLVSADIDEALECYSDTGRSVSSFRRRRRRLRHRPRAGIGRTLSSVAEIDAEAAALHAAVSAAAETTPLRRAGPSRFANAWWSDKLAEAMPFIPTAPPPPPPPELEWPDLQDDELASALSSTRPLAAAGPDNVPNLVLQSLWPTLRLRLVPLFAACLRLGYTPAAWRDATGVVLPKPNKPDYSTPKSYRMIVFARLLAKLLELVVARRLAYLADAHGLLPVSHIGGRRGRSAEDAVACFVDAIKRQWRHGNVVVGMTLDVAQAFPSVRMARLVRNLREKGLPAKVGRFVEAFMTGRSCRLRVDGKDGNEIEWGSGLPQGSPLLPILFLFYNAGAVEACALASSTECGWINDLNLLAWGKTVDEAVSVLQARTPALEKWSETHRAAALPRSRPSPCGVELEWSPTLTMLGAVLDGELNFKAHVSRCAGKASMAVSAVRLLASAGKGLAPREVRTIVVPRAMWMAEMWFDPAKKTVSKMLEAVQRRAMLAITSAYRTTSLAALQVEANSPPLDLVAQRRTFRLALRALSSTPTHLLYTPRRLAQARRPRSHPSPVQRALAAFPSILPPSVRVEPLIPLPLPPWEPEPVVTVVIAESKEEAARTHNTILNALPPSHLVAYSDGSLLDGRAGAGVLLRAVLDGQSSELERGRAMGQSQSVYAAELEGARLALATAIPLAPVGFHAILLALDNQSVLLQPFSPSPSAGQQGRLALRSLARYLTETAPECVLTFLWVPGHVGVDGNKRADELAKRAAEVGEEELSRMSSEWSEYSGCELHGETREVGGGGEGEGEVEGRVWAGREGGSGLLAGGEALPKALSALRQAQREEEKEEWARRWSAASTGAGLREVDPRPPGSAYVRHVHALPRRHAAVLSRLRLDFSDLGGTKRFLALDDPERLCGPCGVLETRQHYLIDCPRYRQQRRRLRRNLGGRTLSLALLFTPSSTTALLRYIHATERFPRLYAALPAASDA